MKTNLLVPITQGGEGSPIYFVPSAGSTLFSFVKLARSLKSQLPVHAFDLTAMEGSKSPHTSIEEITLTFLAEIRAVQKSGPYYLGGHCWGGIVALDIAAKLEAEGDTVALLVLLESVPPLGNKVVENLSVTNEEAQSSTFSVEFNKFMEITVEQIRQQLSRLPPKHAKRFGRLSWEQMHMGSRYRATHISAPIILFRTRTHPDVVFQDWKYFSDRGFTEQIVPGDTFSMLSPPYVDILGAELDKALRVPHSERC